MAGRATVGQGAERFGMGFTKFRIVVCLVGHALAWLGKAWLGPAVRGEVRGLSSLNCLRCGEAGRASVRRG